MPRCLIRLALAAVLVLPAAAAPPPSSGPLLPLSQITSIAGVRDNMLVGYGLVVGLNRTGDSNQTVFTTQTLSNILQRMGVQVPPQAMMVYNVAAVFITATLPPFSRSGMHIDVTVSSAGDARSLSGGLLLLSALHGPDGAVYAEAQGAVTVGSPGGSRNQGMQDNVGIIPAGGIVERNTAVDLTQFKQLSLLLRDPGFVTAESVAQAINQALGGAIAHAVDSREIDVQWPAGAAPNPEFIAKVEAVRVAVTPPARVVVDERTGTIVVGNYARLSPVSIMHAGLAIEVGGSAPPPSTSTTPPGGDNNAQSTHIVLAADSTVQDLVNALQAIGAGARDIVGILRAIEAAGALQANLQVI